ncbi:MAG TPA: CopD family protein [Kofleriaceae bacterium]|jgi:putative membrane protein|nr:CopD family protein [Kofleriaceae bacterium]
MTPETYNWLRVGHILGFVLWVGGLVTVLQLLRVHGMVEGAARDVLGRAERKAAVLMDLGATLALVCGFWMAFGGTVNAFKTGGWLHIKLTIVLVGILAVHGFARVKVKKFRKGEVKPIPAALTYVVLVAAAAAITLGANRDLLRKNPEVPAAPAPATTEPAK